MSLLRDSNAIIHMAPTYRNLGNEKYVLLMEEMVRRHGFRFEWKDDFRPDVDVCDLAISVLSPMHNSPNAQLGLLKYPPSVKVVLYLSELRNPRNDLALVINTRGMMDRADLILCPYQEAFLSAYHDYREKFVFFPHFYSPNARYEALKMNVLPRMKCLVTGHKNSIYPLRDKLLSSKLPEIDVLRHPGYFWPQNYAASDQYGDGYARMLNQYFCAVATPSKYNYALAKYFEIPAAGCLTLAKRISDYDAVGFRPDEHYVEIDETQFEDQIMDCLAHPDRYASIRAAGMEHVRNHHSLSHRVEALERILESLLIKKSKPYQPLREETSWV